jgi:hypothetical protein
MYTFLPINTVIIPSALSAPGSSSRYSPDGCGGRKEGVQGRKEGRKGGRGSRKEEKQGFKEEGRTCFKKGRKGFTFSGRSYPESRITW